MSNRFVRPLLFFSSLPVLGEWFAPLWVKRMERAFVRANIDWNGRRSCLLLSFDCDFPEDVLALPQVASLLERHSLKASFACVGRWVEDYPEAHRLVLAAGHEVFNHSYSHPELVNSPQHFVSFRADLNPRPWEALSRAEQQEEIRHCQEVVRQLLGCEMKGFRLPHFGRLRPAAVYPFLAELGLSYSSSRLASQGRRGGIPHWQGRVLEIPVTPCPRHPFAALDSWHALYARGGWHRRDFFDLLRSQLERAVQGHGLINLYLDPKDWERLDLPRILALVASRREDCWTPTYAEFAEWYRHRTTPEVRDER